MSRFVMNLILMADFLDIGISNYHEDFEKREGRGVVARERHESHMSK